MPSFDREAALKSAEKSLRLGKIEAAIAEYVRIVEMLPRDWNSANALGDLYVRAGQSDRGIAQFTRIADHLANEGFYPKAAALYKKILKVKPADEYALLQSGDIAAKQGLLADAKTAFKSVADLRRNKGDRKGAAEISIRIGTLDPEDVEARLGAARAALDIGDTTTALREFREVALKLEAKNKPAEALTVFQLAFDIEPNDAGIRGTLLDGYLRTGDLARARKVAATVPELKQIAAVLERTGDTLQMLDVLEHVVALDPRDLQVRAALAQGYAAQGDLEHARRYLSAETAGTNAALWLTLAEVELVAGRLDEGGRAVARALQLDASQREAAVALGCRLAERSADAGYPCLDAVADAALAKNDYAAAAAALHEFVTRVRYHVVALMRLVEICVDGRLEATMYEAQAQLADAYLEVGRGLEARIISEDLVAREPWNRANIERFRRALVMLGEVDPDAIIADRLSGDSPFLATDKLDLNEGVSFDDPPLPPSTPTSPGKVAATVATPAAAAAVAAAAAAVSSPQRSRDHVFTDMRNDVDNSADEEAAAEQFGLAVTYQELGMTDEAILALEEAAKSPRRRFEAAAMLARMLLERGDRHKAIQWFERAAEAPAPTADEGHALLYDLAETLDKTGERARALAIFVELEAESGGYRDVAIRINRLSKAQAKG